jgi:cytochrome c-type biogenesis protein CcmE
LFLAAGIFFLLTAIKRSKRLKNEDEAYTETSENSRNPKRTIIALLLMAAIIALTLVFLRAQPSGIETFSSVMTENGYTVSDMTDELRTDWRVGSLIEDSRSLHTEDMRIDFCVMDSTDSARRIYSGMTLPVKDGEEYTYKGTNYTFFSIEDDNLYTAKIYSGNTVIYAAASHECRDELVDLLRRMGYYK